MWASLVRWLITSGTIQQVVEEIATEVVKKKAGPRPVSVPQTIDPALVAAVIAQMQKQP